MISNYLPTSIRASTSPTPSSCMTSVAFQPFFIEDPLRAENPHQYRISANTGAAGNRPATMASKWEFREVIERDLIDYARVDVTAYCGGAHRRQ